MMADRETWKAYPQALIKTSTHWHRHNAICIGPETMKQRHRDTETQRHRHGDTERHRDGDRETETKDIQSDDGERYTNVR